MSARHHTWIEAALAGDVDGTAASLAAWPNASGLREVEDALVAERADGLALVLLARRFGLPLDALVQLHVEAIATSAEPRTAPCGTAVLSTRPAELAEVLAWLERGGDRQLAGSGS